MCDFFCPFVTSCVCQFVFKSFGPLVQLYVNIYFHSSANFIACSSVHLNVHFFYQSEHLDGHQNIFTTII